MKIDHLQGESFEFGFLQSTQSKHVVECVYMYVVLDKRIVIPHTAPRYTYSDLQVVVL